MRCYRRDSSCARAAVAVTAATLVAMLLLTIPFTAERAFARRGGECYPDTGRSPAPARADEGLFYITTNADVEAFISECDTLHGSVDIACADLSITNLDVFKTVETITGYLRIEGCHNLTDLTGFSNLKTIRGDALYDIPSQQKGFALLLRNNDALTDLSGLQNLTTVSGYGALGLGRVGVFLNDNLCYSTLVDWTGIIGHDLDYRVVEVSEPLSCQLSAACSADCACGYCFGPTSEDCQGSCRVVNKRERAIIIGILVFCGIFAIIAFVFVILYTHRCGCRMRLYSKAMKIGVLREDGVSSKPPQQSVRHRRESQDPVNFVGKATLDKLSSDLKGADSGTTQRSSSNVKRRLSGGNKVAPMATS